MTHLPFFFLVSKKLVASPAAPLFAVSNGLATSFFLLIKTSLCAVPEADSVPIPEFALLRRKSNPSRLGASFISKALTEVATI